MELFGRVQDSVPAENEFFVRFNSIGLFIHRDNEDEVVQLVIDPREVVERMQLVKGVEPTLLFGLDQLHRLLGAETNRWLDLSTQGYTT